MNIHLAVLNEGWVHGGLTQVLIQLASSYRRGPLTIALSGLTALDRPIPSNRNKIVRDTPEDADVLVMLDCDCVPPLDFLDAAWLDLDIVGLPMPIYSSGKIYTGIIPLDGRETSAVGSDEVVECSAVAGGAMIISQRVFRHPGMWFHDEFGERGIIASTDDYVYCRQARGLGFRVWAALKYPLSHFKQVDLKRMWEGRLDAIHG